MHDARALTESGFLDIEDDDPDRSPHPRHIADKGYTGLDLITPTKKPAGPPQTEANKICNRATGKIRRRIEQTIAHLKNWHALKTRHRRPINTFPDTITATLGIIFTYTL
ncbi:transposase family protein [Propionibacterium acidifaciens]|uniref:transposase family protein n=1 Tax=Propionibacterium acidifaciens TaxID=556499 RepID=UPI0018C9155C